jgi:16S rRNA (guanine527-N7)-methyltransferase
VTHDSKTHSSRRSSRAGAAPGDSAPSAVRLVRDAASLGIALSDADAARLCVLLEELARWNRRYNLTAVTARADMLTHHVLDSLAVHPDLAGNRIADVGTGAGFPGLPLAVCNPQRQFTLIDSTAKKIRFVSHAARLLGLDNVTAVHARIEALKPQIPFDTAVARAFAPLPRMLRQVDALCGAESRVLAMKGTWPESELAALPAGWRVLSARPLTIPGLAAARCLIVLARV